MQGLLRSVSCAVSPRHSCPTNEIAAVLQHLAIRYRGVNLTYRTFDKLRQVSQAAIVENKHLGAALAFIREEQLRRGPERRSAKAPRRRDQSDTRLFKVG